MKIAKLYPWVFYIGEEAKTLQKDKCGKWMYFFDNKEFAAEMCEKAVMQNVVVEAKYKDLQSGVACFYLNSDDLERHKKIINFFLENNLIQRTKTGKLYNISFKLNEQTRAGEYGDDFKAEIKLDQFINLETGEWKLD